MKTILLVESNIRVGNLLDSLLSVCGFKVIVCGTLMDAIRAYENNKKDICAAVLDGYLTDDFSHKVDDMDTTLPLIVKMAGDGFKGPIVAASECPGMREKMVSAGCTYQCEKKAEVAFLISRLFREASK